MELIDEAIKKAGVIIILGGNGVKHATDLKVGFEAIKANEPTGNLFFTAMSGSRDLLLSACEGDDSIKGIAAREISQALDTLKADFEAGNVEPEPVAAIRVSVEEIQTQVDSLTSSLSFGLSRLAGGRVDDLSITAIENALYKNTPAIVEMVTNFINQNADENDELIDQLNEISRQLVERSALVKTLESEKARIAEELRTKSNDLARKEDIITGLNVKARESARTIKEFEAMDPARLKRNLAESKVKNADLTASVKSMTRQISVHNAAMDFMRTQYAKLDANYLVMTETHKDIVSSMERLTGETLEGNLAYQRSDESEDYAWVHIFYLQRYLSDVEKQKPVGQRRVNYLSFSLEIRTSYDVNFDVNLSEWGYVVYPIVPNLSDWFGVNLVAATQEMYDQSVEATYPELWARFKHLRSIDIADVPALSEKTVAALKASGINNVGQVGSNSAERLKAIAGVSLTEAKKALALCYPYFDKWVAEHGSLNVFESHKQENKAQIDKTMAECLRRSVARLRDEVPKLFARVDMSLADQFTESLSEYKENSGVAG